MSYTADELSNKQFEIERRGKDLGSLRYDERTEKALKSNRMDGTSFGTILISKNTIKLKEAYQEAITKRRDYRVPAIFKLIENIKPEVVSMVTLSSLIGTLGACKTATHTGQSIALKLFHEAQLSNLQEEGKKHFTNLIQKKNIQGQEAIKALQYVSDVSKSTLVPWSKKDLITLGRVMISLVEKSTNLISIEEGERRVNNKSAPEVVIATTELNDWIKSHREEVRLLSPVYMPMVVKPKDWTAENVLNGCYLTNEQAPVPFVKRKRKIQIQKLIEENPTNVFEAVNKIQSTAWRIRRPVLNLLKRLQDERIDLGLPISSMPSQNDQPVDVNAPYYVQKEQKLHNQELANIRSIVSVNIATAEEFSEFDRFYVPHHLDTRGRVYPIPTLNPQGADYIKGILEFAEGMPLGESGIYWLKVHTANLFGVDKVPFDDRVSWVTNNWSNLLGAALDPLGNLFWTKADKPIQAFAACLELLGVSMEGEKFVSRMPIALDGSCSGLQHLGAAFRCEVTAKAVNLIDSVKPNDIYQDVANKVQSMLENETTEENKSLAKQWMSFCGGKISRKITKRPVMTFPYGSKAPGFTQQIIEDTLKPVLKTRPEDVPFENPRVAAQYIARLIEKAVSETVLKASEAMEWLQDTAKLIAKQGDVIHWSTPLGFPVVQEYRKEASRRINTIVFGSRLQSRYNEEIDDIDTRKMSNAISPNVVHSLDSTHLLLTILRAAEEDINQFALIHDSFGTHAAKTDRFFNIIRETFKELYEEDVFSDLHDQFSRQIRKKKSPQLPSKGSYDLELILNSSFSFA